MNIMEETRRLMRENEKLMVELSDMRQEYAIYNNEVYGSSTRQEWNVSSN